VRLPNIVSAIAKTTKIGNGKFRVTSPSISLQAQSNYFTFAVISSSSNCTVSCVNVGHEQSTPPALSSTYRVTSVDSIYIRKKKQNEFPPSPLPRRTWGYISPASIPPETQQSRTPAGWCVAGAHSLWFASGYYTTRPQKSGVDNVR